MQDLLSSLNAGISINERHWIISHVTFGSVKFKSSNWKPLKRGYRYELNNCILDREIREIIWECRCMPHFATSNSEYLEFIPFCSGKKLYCANMILKSISMDEDYGNTGCRVFEQGVQNWKDFCLKINIPKENYWILRIGVIRRCQKVTKFNFQSHFLRQKSSESFCQFNSTFFVIDIFW